MTTATESNLVSYDVAQKIMGSQMILPEQVEGVFGKSCFLSRTPTQLSSGKFSRDTLEGGRDSHLLLPVLPISILEMMELMPKLFRRPDWQWYENNDFAKARGVDAGWCIIKKDVINNSLGLSFSKWSFAFPEQTLPTARELVFSLLLWVKVSGQRLLPQRYAWSRDELPVGGEHVCVGYFDEGLDIVPMADICEYPSYGIVPLRFL